MARKPKSKTAGAPSTAAGRPPSSSNPSKTSVVIDDKLFDLFIRALVSREMGRDQEALRYLDEASVLCRPPGDAPRPRKGRGRPSLAVHDPDRLAIRVMNWRAADSGERRAETLAKYALRMLRQRGHSETADVKRLAAKWKAKAKI